MDNLHPQAELLLGYADQQLSEPDIARAEKLLAEDPEAVAFLKKLGISDLPFVESFEFMLKEKTKLSAVETVESTIKKTWFMPASLAASLLLGIGIGFYSFALQQHDHDNWITQVADYHLLYGRETVEDTFLSDQQLITLKNKLNNAIESNLIIPDLSAEKLNFKRGQILDKANNPLIQLVYLPQNGKPIALCLLRTDAPDSSIKEGKSRGMPYYTWSKNGLSYVIVGDMDKQSLKDAAINAATQLEG